MPRIITFKEAIREAQEEALKDPSVFLIGEGVPDPKAVFGTTAGLQEKFPNQVFDMPVSENGVTGVCIGAAVNGMKPILVHQRMDFSLYSMDQIVNNAAKWFSMYGGNGGSVPMVIRMIIGRGWGAGNQHSQNLTAMFAHVPGLKVFFPTNARDAKRLFLQAVADPNPVIFIEHRWLYETTSDMDARPELQPDNAELCVIAIGHSAIEARKAQKTLANSFPIRVAEMQEIKPIGKLDITNRRNWFLIVSEEWEFGGLAAEIGSQLVEAEKTCRLTCPNYPSASSPALTKNYYPNHLKIIEVIEFMVGHSLPVDPIEVQVAHDVPDSNFRGPF